MATIASVATDWTICPICLEVFDNPKSLPCIHGFCLKCLECYFKDNPPGDEVYCPMCRKSFKIPSDGLSGLQHHFFIQHLVDARNASSNATDEVACEVCLEDNEGSSEEISTATVYCIDCRQKLCERCSRPHRRMKGGAHQLKTLGAELEQELIQLGGSYCIKHEDEQVKLYCYDCNENMCVLCLAVKHRNHNSSEIPEVAGSFRQKINDDDQKILSSITAVRLQIEKSKRDAMEYACKIENSEKMVFKSGEAVKRLVDRQVSECISVLQSVKSHSAKQFEVVQEQLQLALVAMESFHTYSRELLDKGRPSDVTRAASELHKRATELLDNDVTSVQYCPTHMTFTPADVTQLTSAQLIGKLSIRKDAPEPTAIVPCVVLEQHQVVPYRPSDHVTSPTQHETDPASTLEQQMKERPMGQVLYTRPQGNDVCGLTSLDNQLYVIRNKESQQISVFEPDLYRLQRRISVPQLGDVTDMTACAHYRCLYASDFDGYIHRVALPDVAVTKWPVNDKPACLSVTDTHSLLVTCDEVRKIKEFTTHGKLLRQIQLPQNVVSPEHTVQLSSGEFFVCHGDKAAPLHRVCLVGSGGQIVKSYGGRQGSGRKLMNIPIHMAVDKNGFVFVADVGNSRVLLLSPSLTYVRDVLSHEQLKWYPFRLFLDDDRRRLYVTENEQDGDDEHIAGRIVVIGV